MNNNEQKYWARRALRQHPDHRKLEDIDPAVVDLLTNLCHLVDPAAMITLLNTAFMHYREEKQ